jgi:hypothetical protein
LPITAVGNNRLVTRAAHEFIGGHEALAFTEAACLVVG